MTAVAVADASRDHLVGRLRLVEERVRDCVDRRRSDDPAPDDPFRGLYLSDEHVDRLLQGPLPGALPSPEAEAELAAVERAADLAPAVRLRDLAAEFGLAPLDVELLLVALAPDVDARFERLYGYLNDDVTRRRASVGLALELCGRAPAQAEARGRLAPAGPLVEGGLVLVEDADRPFLTRSLRVPDRVTSYLLGDAEPDVAVRPFLVDEVLRPAFAVPELARLLRDGLRLTYVREHRGGTGQALATATLAAAGRRVLVVDLARLAGAPDLEAATALLAREARLQRAGLVAGPLDALLAKGTDAVRALTALPVPVVVVGTPSWESSWSDEVPLVLDAPLLTADQRADLWRGELADHGDEVPDPAAVTGQFLLGPEQIRRAATTAGLQARLDGVPLDATHLRQGARAQNAAGLERLARRIEPSVGWPDLVLPPGIVGHLRDLTARARHRDRVLSAWGMRPGGGRGRGIMALFAGDSGTGKTMSSEVIAAELGLDLYTVNLATVVDKYVGETEKNLEHIFGEASGVNGVLLFDEADAIFGKRSEVKDAQDRYANIESAYLLQRMETFDGLAILATNLRSNLDEAFTRRLDMIVDFPSPDPVQRRQLWERCLGSRLPRAADLDVGFCAEAFELSGGNIRSIAITAAYCAAATGSPVAMVDLVRAIEQEYRKLGRLCLPSEFGRYHGLLAG